jgi:hypothetical protein
VNYDAYDFMLSFSKIPKTHTLRTHTFIERKSGMPQIQGVKGEAIVSYAEPLSGLCSLSYGGPSNAGLSRRTFKEGGRCDIIGFPRG